MSARPVRKTCACGATYTRPEWRALERVGFMRVDEGILDLRHCRCNSTIAVLLAADPGEIARAGRAVARARELIGEATRLAAIAKGLRRIAT